jgi:hypothetical protein
MGIFRCENVSAKCLFIPSDWRIFKRMADAHFKEAAFLKKSDMQVEAALKLLARNS